MSGKVFLPQPPGFLSDKLPFEESMDGLLNKLNDNIQNHPITQIMQQVEDRFPVVESMDFPTPFGKIKTPRLQLPSLRPPIMDQRRKEVIKAAVGTDVGSLLELIPVVGDFLEPVGNALADTYRLKVLDTLTPEELPEFKNHDKVAPLTTIAAVQTFIKGK